MLVVVLFLILLCYTNAHSVSAKAKDYTINEQTLVRYSGNAKTFRVPKNVKKISSKAFKNAPRLKKLIIGAKVNNIKPETLRNAKNLETVVVSKKNKCYSSCNGLLYNKSGKQLYECPNAKKNVVISDKCKTINEIAGDGIETIVIGKKVKYYMSEYCVVIGHAPNLRQIEVKDGNKYFFVRDGVLFYNNPNGIQLARYPSAVIQDEYVIPDDVADICSDAFRNTTSLKNVVISKNVKRVFGYPFYGLNLEKITFMGNYDPVSFWIGLAFNLPTETNVKTYVFEDDNASLPTLSYMYLIKPGMTICSRTNSASHKYAVEHNVLWSELK